MTSIIAFATNHYVWLLFIAFYLCNLALGHKSQLDSWVLKHPRVGGILKIIRGVLPCDPWLFIQGMSLIIRGSLPQKLTPIVNVLANDDPNKPNQLNP